MTRDIKTHKNFKRQDFSKFLLNGRDRVDTVTRLWMMLYTRRRMTRVLIYKALQEGTSMYICTLSRFVTLHVVCTIYFESLDGVCWDTPLKQYEKKERSLTILLLVSLELSVHNVYCLTSVGLIGFPSTPPLWGSRLKFIIGT